MRALRVVRSGPATTVQDLGRPGLAHLGVPISGALDGPAAVLANRLVGNPPGDPVLETTLGGVGLEPTAPMTVAVTGARCRILTAGRARAWGEPLTLPAGIPLEVGTATRGLRSYVAVAGGLLVEAVLGSRSTDTLSGLGPAPVRVGQVLPVGRPHGMPAPVGATPDAAWAVGPVPLALHPGPREDWFEVGSLQRLCGAAYVVGSASDRVGLRLEGERLRRSRTGELPSEGLVLGAVQVPASGQPLVFLNDHPTTGGYPVLAVVDPAHLPRCAQLRPGDRVRFVRAGSPEA